MMKRKQIKTFWVFLVLGLLTAACTHRDKIAPTIPTLGSVLKIDPLFRDFYNFLGAQQILGDAISPIITNGEIKCQYTTNALLIYDKRRSESEKFFLAPLGEGLNVAEPPIVPTTPSNDLYVEGHNVYKDIFPIFEKLGGVRYAGRPLAEVRFNPQEKRYEQYFANLGFYHYEGDAPGTGELMPYGSWSRDDTCKVSSNMENPTPITPDINIIFKSKADQLGSDFTGLPITEAYTATDGNVEQIFENIVLMSDISNPNQIKVRPVEEDLGVLPDPPVLSAKGNNNLSFFKTLGDKGYNIPNSFLDYINQHGGLEISGHPITEISQKEAKLRQCFTNLCILADGELADPKNIHLESVGYPYKELFAHSSQIAPATIEPGRTVSLQVRETYRSISTGQAQEITITVTADHEALIGVQPVLTINLPDGQEPIYTFPPTGKDGTSLIHVPPITAQNGTLIPYQICLPNQTGEKYCIKDSYLIWNNPN